MDANELHRLNRNALRKGTILAIDHVAALCRVQSGDLQTNWIPWFAAAAGHTRHWSAPTTGEQVMLLCPMGDPAQAVALRGIYSDHAPAPRQSATAHAQVYADNATIEYDDASHALTATLPAGATVRVISPGSVTVQTAQATIEAQAITLDATQTTCTGALLVKGGFAFESGMTGKGGDSGATMQIDGGAEFTHDVKAAGISVRGHHHMSQGESAPTSEPLQ
ncbi:MAG: phage baseplate assembly protein V [Janthinobacterium lividum]